MLEDVRGRGAGGNGQIAEERKSQVGTTSIGKGGGANSRSPVGKCNPVLSRAVTPMYSDGWVSTVGGTGESRRASGTHRRAEESAGATASRVQVVG